MSEVQEEVISEESVDQTVDVGSIDETEAKEISGDNLVTIPKAELDALKAERAQRRRDARKAEERLKAAEEAKLAEAGQFKELAEQLREEKLALEAKIVAGERQKTVRKIAESYRFRDPDVAYRLLDENTDLDDSESVTLSLKRLAEQSPYLVRDEVERTGLPVTDGDVVATAAQAQQKLKSLSGRQLAELSNEEFSQLQRAAAK